MRFLPILILFFLTSCSNSTLQNELKQAKLDLATTKAELQKATQEISTLKQEDIGKLVHIVFFKLKPEVDTEKLIGAIKKLQAIPEVEDLEVGFFENLGDARALSDYQLVMEMTFLDKAAYDKYQQHPIHLELKDKLGSFLAGPPATYDFMALR